MKPRTKIKRNHNNSIIAHYKMVADHNGEVVIGDRYSRHSMINYDHVSLIKEPNAYRFYYWQCHKIGGPAYIDHVDGIVQWFIANIPYTSTSAYCDVCGFNKIKKMQWVLKYGTTLPTTPDEV